MKDKMLNEPKTKQIVSSLSAHTAKIHENK
jgi:hypothetical protein